jgi:hypothetical protein
LSSKDGTVPSAVAARLAGVAPTPATPTRRPRVTRLVDVDTTDTIE